jgi:hypothetical protein
LHIQTVVEDGLDVLTRSGVGGWGAKMRQVGMRIWLCVLAVLALLVWPAQVASAQGAPSIAWMGGGTIGVQGMAVSYSAVAFLFA